MSAETETARQPAKAARPETDVVQDRLAQYSHALKFEALPAGAVHAAKGLIVDTLGVLLAAYPYEPCARLRRIAPRAGAGEGATLLGGSARTSLDFAAFANASTARYLEGNDVFARFKPGTAHGHPSDVIAPLLAVAEQTHASGRDFLAAVILAYEIYLRLCDSCHSAGFDAASFGCIAIAAATARLLGQSTDQIAQAVAIAATTHNILKQVRSDRVTVWKALAAGEAGRAGVQAAELSGAGIAGPSLPFVGTGGWCDHVAGKRFELEEMGGGATPFLVCDSRIKTRPVRALTISAILAAEKLAGRVGNLAEVSRIVVATYRRAKRGTGPEHWIAANRETADHSVPYCVAVALIDGIVTPASFDDRHLANPLLRALIAKMEIVEDEAFTSAYTALPQAHRSRVSVYGLGGGLILEAESGGDEDDLASAKSDGWVERKFRAMAEGLLGPGRTESLLKSLWTLDGCPDIAGLVPAMAIDAEAQG